ncbi:MAG: peptide chain release factor 1 [Clostridiaceae bacterium]|jgi:peptide chain release factor 1|nr:peptide chain release factor 1 [Clostridiaceae bacterium]
MFEQLKVLSNRLDELNILLADPAVIADQGRYLRLVQEHADLEPVVHDYQAWIDLCTAIDQHRRLLTDSDDQEFRELVRDELSMQDAQLRELEDRLNEAVSPKDPNDARNVVMEIRAGAGGDEAALFAAVLYRMYSLYAESKGWHVQLVDVHETEIGGFKEVVFLVEGQGAYSRLRFESGVHRVQRVPVTESGGRIHTSTVTVAVLPEADDVEIEINPNDLAIDTFRASGAGGQHVNKTDSAIRITHKPTGIVVTCQDQRSQYKNKDQAMAVLKARLLEREQSYQTGSIADDRRSQVGTGDRSERIRTYNYHQGRVTDHRIGLTLYRLESVLSGDIDEIIQALMTEAKSQQRQGEARP